MTPAAWGGLLLAWSAAIILPGPDVFLLLRLGIRHRGAAVRAACGVMTGTLIWLVLSVLGLTAMLAVFPPLLPILQVCGSIVLVWLGVTSVRSGVTQLRTTAPERPATTAARPWLLGLTTNLANPKVLIFFTALFTQFLPSDAAWPDRLLIIVVLMCSGLTWFVSVALASSTAGFRRWFGRAAPWFDVGAGVLFVVIALVIVAEVILALTGA